MQWKNISRRLENIGLLVLITLAFIALPACGSDDQSESLDGDELAQDGDEPTDGDESEIKCPPGMDWDETEERCIPATVSCPDGFNWNPALRRCEPGNPSCPPGFEWDSDLGRCAPPATEDGDLPTDGDEEAEEDIEDSAPQTCRSNWDCPFDRECGEDEYCSVWSSGEIQGSIETLVYQREAPNSFASPGKIWGRYRGEGIRIGYGAEAWYYEDPELGEVLSFTIMDLLANDLHSAFTVTIRRDLLESGAEIAYDASDIKGYLLRHRVDGDNWEIIEEILMGQVLGGLIKLGHVNIVHHGRFNADFSFYLGPVLDNDFSED